MKLIPANNGQNEGGDLNQWRFKRALAGGGSLPAVSIDCLNATHYLTGEEPIAISANLFTK